MTLLRLNTVTALACFMKQPADLLAANLEHIHPKVKGHLSA